MRSVQETDVRICNDVLKERRARVPPEPLQQPLVVCRHRLAAIIYRH